VSFPPLRIAHLADIHVGMESYGRLNPETGLNQRLHDFLQSLDQAIEGALAADVHLVVLAGDIYRSRDPSPTHQREFARRVRRLLEARVPIFIVAGNHDLPLSASRATSIDIFRALDVPGITVARVVGLHTVGTRAGPLQILAFPWTVRSTVLVQPEYKNRTIAELNQAMIDLNRQKLLADAQTLDPTLPTIVAGHAHLRGGRVGAERVLTMGSDPMYDLGVFDLPGVDYVALGHLHKHQALNYARPGIVYAGSIDRVDFGEEGEDKGWVLVEIPEKGVAEWAFHRLQGRRFLTIDTRVESDNATAEVVRAIVRHGEAVRDAVVRVRIDIAAERLGELQEDAIRGQLKTAYHVTPFELTLRGRTRQRWGGDHTALQQAQPLEALAYYLDQQQVEPERREVLLSYARGLVHHEPGA
jgi:DNA repair protein SbcD/Mre11